jgi:hypothetical protein
MKGPYFLKLEGSYLRGTNLWRTTEYEDNTSIRVGAREAHLHTHTYMNTYIHPADISNPNFRSQDDPNVQIRQNLDKDFVSYYSTFFMTK